jgi:ribonucleotide reductase alpha subunit
MNLKFYFHHYNYNMNQKAQSMFVIKRNGDKENVLFDKITNRIKKLMYDIEDIEPAIITQKLCARIIPGITTTELDNLASQICMSMLTDNPNYGILGARIAISNHQKNTDNNFLEVLTKLRNNKDIHNEPSPLINEDLISLATKYEKEINDMINYERDYLIDFFGFKTLEKSYLLKINKKSIERPQHLFMRVALAIHRDDLVNVKKTYDNLSLKNYTHATPTLFNAGCPSQQLSSCYLIATEDSVEGIFETMTDCAKISKWSGGIGLHISNIRANGSYIRKTAGYSDGIMPMLKVYNDIARYINQCFTPETIVYTTSGPKEISNILEGDKVITIDGTPKRVLGIKKTNINKNILKIKSTYSADFVNVTGEHQIYVLRGQRKMLRHNVIINRLEKNIIKEEYISAKEMNTNDILCYPIPVITEYFKIDKDICRFYGIMLGDGHISKKKNSNSKEAGITMGFAKTETINFVKQLLEKYKIYYWEEMRETNCIKIGWTHTNLENTLGFCYDDLYDSNHHKRVAKRFLNMNNENTLSLIRGLIETDGSIGNEIYFSSTSKNLIESLRYCLLRLGILSSGYIKNNIGNISSYKNITTRLLSYNLRIPKDTLLCKELGIEPSKKLGYFRYKNTLYSKIKSISNFEYEGEVFDLNIEDNHNYLTQMGLVHNSGKRNGSFAIYIEPWHADIFTFLDAKKNHGSEELRARDLFYALWVPDLFMKAIEEDGDWYLMCPDKCPGLPDVYGEEFDKLYFKYVVENKYNKKIKARELWDAIISSQIETGVPYMLYKDAANKKSNQKNIDTIKSSNLCAEILEVSNQEETAVCLTSDTIIITEEGPKLITECDNLNVLSFYNNDEDLVKDQQYIKAKLINNGVKEVFEIDLVGGFPIKATKNHKFLVLKNRNYNTKNNVYEWKTVEELTLKDRINRAKIDPLPIYKDVDIKTQNDLESLVVGWMIGDGWQRSYETGHYYTYGVCFGSTEIYAQKIVIDYLNIIQNSLGAQKNGHNKPIKAYTSKNGVVQWASSKKSFAEYFIEKYGLEPKLGIHKNLSDKIKKLKPNKIASILSGLFSADGTVYKTKTKFYVGLSSSSKELLIDTQVLLKCFGITSGLVFTEVKSRNRFQGKLTIQNRDSIKLFSKYINFLLCPEKKNKLEDGILNHKYLRDIDEKEWMSIRNIKSVGFENVYDLNIPNTHNFIANMVTTHNCNLASICLPSILEYPNKSYHDWYDLLTHEEKQLSEYYFRGRLKILSETDCVYCKLLKALLKEVGLEYEEISSETAEELRQFCARPIPDKFTTIPQLFSIIEDGEVDEVKHLGGYTKTWNLLSPKINHNRLRDLSYDLTKNLNKIIDINYYPTEKTKVSNMRHRPIGIGVQGLADLFLALKLPFDSVGARKINKEIFETIYFGALDSSHTLAFKEGPYSTFDGSPLSEGILQFNMWGLKDEDLSGRWKWNSLRKNIMRDGVRNSLLVALMPTASTSQIMGSAVECFEPLTSNLYTRRTLAGEFVIINPYLVKDLINLDMWNEDIKNRLQYDKGSVKNIKNFPFKDIYRTVWEIPQKSLIEMSADRGAFVCQSQSLNLFFEKPEYKKLSMAHLLGWKLGLKTGSYYIRSKPATSAQRFAMDADVERKLKEEDLQNKEETECLSCGA